MNKNLRRIVRTLLALAAAVVLAMFLLVQLRPSLAYTLLRGLEMRGANVHDVKLRAGNFEFAMLAGGSGPPLVLLHGFAVQKESWLRTLPHLTKEFSVIVPDLPGHGDTRSLGDPLYYDAKTQAKRIKRLVDILEIAPVHLAGHSMGGSVAAAYAALFPDDIRTLWLVAPGGVEGAERSEAEVRLRAGENLLVAETPEQYEALSALTMHDPPYVPKAILGLFAERSAERAELHRSIHNDFLMRMFPLEKALAGTRLPVLISWGALDRVLHPSGAEVLRKVVPHAVVEVHEDVGHAPLLESPARTAADFVSFAHDVARGAITPSPRVPADANP